MMFIEYKIELKLRHAYIQMWVYLLKCSHFSFPEISYDYVTCISSLKLINSYHSVRLHSHDVKYGSGSGQQVILYYFLLNFYNIPITWACL